MSDYRFDIMSIEQELGIPTTVLEKLAANEHDRWSDQAKAALYEMTPERRERWTIFADTPYDELAEEVKELDRIQVREYLVIMRDCIMGTRHPTGGHTERRDCGNCRHWYGEDCNSPRDCDENGNTAWEPRKETME